MQLQGWCGHCGDSFRVAELTDAGFSGRCPRCGADLAPGYTSVASAAVHDLIAAAGQLQAAAGRLGQTAPRLHIDARKLTADVAEALGES